MSLALRLFLALGFLLSGPACAQDPNKNPFRVEVTDLSLAPGASGNVTISVIVPHDYHVYRDMMHVKVLDAHGLTVSEPNFPPGRNLPDPSNTSQMREMYDMDVVVDVAVTAPSKPGTYDLDLEVAYQGCKKTLCWLPVIEEQTAKVTVGDVPKGTADAAPADGLPFSVKPGKASSGLAVMDVSVKEPWHVNRDFLTVTVDDGSPYTLGELDLPAGTKFEDPSIGISRMDLGGDFTIKVPVSGPTGHVELPLTVLLQACKATLCKMPEPVRVTVPVDVGPVVAVATVAPAIATQGSAFDAARSAGILPLLGLVFVAGLGVSLTPCVLPMVPITIGIIGARSAGSRLQAIALSATYVAGLALVYSALGIAAGFTGMMFGAWMQSIWVVGAIAIFFVIMGAAMFGLFDIGLPSALQTRLSQVGGGGGFGGAFVIGMVGALVAGPCSGPVLLSIIALIGQKGEVALGALLMIVFSLGMGMIFLAAGAFSTTLLRPGAWMDTVKKSFGIVMWVGAIYFLAPHLSATTTALVTAAMLMVTATFAWPADESEGFWIARTRKLYSVVGGLIGAYLLVGVLATKGFILPPVQLATAPSAGPGATGTRIAWSTDEPKAIELAQAQNRPLLIDFTADWCAACKELEHYTYTDPQVIAASAGMVPVMVDATDGSDPQVKALLEKYEVRGLPTVKFLSPDGKPIEELTVTGFVEAEHFLPRMEAALRGAG
jgi:thioredoxin:protein disulfide reductase